LIVKNLVTLTETDKMRISFFIVFLILSIKGFAQNHELILELKKKLNPNPTVEQFDLLNSIGWEYRFAQPDSTIYYALKAYDLGRALKIKGLAKSLNFVGVAYNYKGDKLKSYDYYQKASRVAESQYDSIQLAYTSNNIGRLLFDQGLLPKSFNYFVTALQFFKALGDSSGLAYTNQSLANLYSLQQDFIKAEETHKKALAIRLKLNNPRDIMSAYMQLGMLFQETNDLSRSNEFFLRADSIAAAMKDTINLAEMRILMAENYLQQDRIDVATKLGKEGFDIIVKNSNVRMKPRAYLLMGKVHLANKNFAAAKVNFGNALRVSKEIKSSEFQIDSYFQLAQLATLMGNKQDGVLYMNHYLVLKDSVEDLDLARQVERLQFAFQIESKDKENEILKLNQASTQAMIRRQEIMNILLGIVVFLLSILAIVTWQVSKRRRLTSEKLALQNEQINMHQREIDEQNEVLSKRNQSLSDLNHEKGMLMNIVAHDLKSPLNRIMGLSTLIELEGKLTINQQEYLQMVKGVTKSGINLITDLLDASAMEENPRPPASLILDLSHLLKENINHFQGLAVQKRINLEYIVPEAIVFASDASYISRIVENLLSNAIKFSKPNTTVTILGRYENRKAYISIKDQGPGFTETDKASLFKKFKKLSAQPTASESSNGLGLAIVKILVNRLGGTIDLVSELGKGSEFIVILPAYNPQAELVDEATSADLHSK
jgi:signal transduction histidine kinase